jgi:hypothetical protein
MDLCLPGLLISTCPDPASDKLTSASSRMDMSMFIKGSTRRRDGVMEVIMAKRRPEVACSSGLSFISLSSKICGLRR